MSGPGMTQGIAYAPDQATVAVAYARTVVLWDLATQFGDHLGAHPGIFRIMSQAVLTARVRTIWERLAGAPVAFAPVVRVAVSPRSRLCPQGWAGLVVIAGAAIATAPDTPTGRIMQRALSAGRRRTRSPTYCRRSPPWPG
jgi:hypothetical protein